MLIYIISYIVTILFFLSRKNNIILFIAFSVFLIIVLGLRGENVGVDTEQYYDIFSYISIDGYPKKDLLFYYTNKLVSYLGFEAEVVMLLFSLVTVAPISYVIYKISPYAAVSYALLLAFGFFSFYFNGMRQGAAISLGFISVYYLIEDKKTKSVLFFLFALLTHSSALILLISILVIKLKKITFSFTVVFLWLLSIYSAIFGNVFYIILSKLSFAVPERFLVYIVSSDLDSVGPSFLFDQLMFCLLYSSQFYVKNIKQEYYIRFGMIGIIFMHLFSGVLFVDRLALYYYIFTIISIPIAMFFISGKRNRVIFIGLLWILLLVQHTYRISLNPHEIVPYYTIYS